VSSNDAILDLKAPMGRSIIGQEHIVERLLIGLLANGNLLVEGLPGLAKTRAVRSLAENMEASFSRIQFTPDDVRAVVHDCVRHRLILSYEANAAGVTPNQVVDELISSVAGA